MTRLVLPGGTDIAEVGFFVTDALPLDHCPDPKGLSELERNGKLVRMPTGSDGGYLLHVYADEAIPSELLGHCLRDDKLEGQIHLTSGNVAFGGLESAYQRFKANENIRCDATLPPGAYKFVAYHTEYPDDLVEDDINTGLSKSEQRYLAVPGYAVPVAFVTTAIAVAAQRFAVAAALVASWYLFYRTFRRSAKYQSLRQRRTQRELKYPSIVIEMWSDRAADPRRSAPNSVGGRVTVSN
jgi:hypothetical protein